MVETVLNSRGAVQEQCWCMCCCRLVEGQELHDVLDRLWERAAAMQGSQRQEDIQTWLWALRECICQVLQVKVSALQISLTSQDQPLSEHCRPGMSTIGCYMQLAKVGLCCPGTNCIYLIVCFSMQGDSKHDGLTQGAAILLQASTAAASFNVWS